MPHRDRENQGASTAQQPLHGRLFDTSAPELEAIGLPRV
jgi:hypothetical protein